MLQIKTSPVNQFRFQSQKPPLKIPHVFKSPIGWIFILCVVSFLIILSLVFAPKQNDDHQVQPLPSEIPSQLFSIVPVLKFQQLEGWNEFQSSTYQYRLKIPPEWVIQQGGVEESRIELIGPDDQKQPSILLINIANTAYASVSAYLKDVDEYSKTSYEGSPSAQVKKTQLLSLDNVDVVVREEYLPGADLEVASLYGVKNGYAYLIRIRPAGSNRLASEQIDLFRRISGTLHFLDEYDNLKWQVYQDKKLNITLRYPQRLQVTPDKYAANPAVRLIGSSKTDAIYLNYILFAGSVDDLINQTVAGRINFPLYQVSVTDYSENFSIFGNKAVRYKGKGGDTLVFATNGTSGFLLYTSIKDLNEVNLILNSLKRLSDVEEGICVPIICPVVTSGCSWKMTLDRCKCGELMCDR